jgi:uncharacterized protein (DUF427 family)
MGLSWQQGPLAPGAVGSFLVSGAMPAPLIYAEPLRRRMRVRFGDAFIADSETAVLLFEPGRYPVAYFPEAHVSADAVRPGDLVTHHRELGPTLWYVVRSGDKRAERGAWRHTDPPSFASELRGRIAFAWTAMDAFFEEDERILGHASDPYHRIDIRQTSRHFVVRQGDRVIADSKRPRVLYESGFAPRWYVPREDVDQSALTAVENQTFCPYKGVCSYYDVGSARLSVWSYREAYREVDRIRDMLSFEADVLAVTIDGFPHLPEPGQGVVPHGPDRGLTVEEAGRGAARVG